MPKRTQPPKSVVSDRLRAFQAAASANAAARYELVLYIAGTTPQSSTALETLAAVCAERIAGRYDLAVVDVYQEPARARLDQIIAVPTLDKKRPLPLRRLIGDLSDRSKLLLGLGLSPDASDENGR